MLSWLATLIDADRIVVLDAGRVAERGTHDELIRRDGLYSRSDRRQTESIIYGAGC